MLIFLSLYPGNCPTVVYNCQIKAIKAVKISLKSIILLLLPQLILIVSIVTRITVFIQYKIMTFHYLKFNNKFKNKIDVSLLLSLNCLFLKKWISDLKQYPTAVQQYFYFWSILLVGAKVIYFRLSKQYCLSEFFLICKCFSDL